eukprot:2320521-Prymnesium_polylepis.1
MFGLVIGPSKLPHPQPNYGTAVPLPRESTSPHGMVVFSAAPVDSEATVLNIRYPPPTCGQQPVRFASGEALERVPNDAVGFGMHGLA